MFKYGFNVLWSKEDEGFIATCPDFPGLSAFGETAAEALTEAQIVLDLFVESLQASGDPLPEPSEIVEFSGQVRLRMPKSLHSSLAQNAAKEGISLNTWMITLLAERNTAQNLADKVCYNIEEMNKNIKKHREETKQLKLVADSMLSTVTNIAAIPTYYIAPDAYSTRNTFSELNIVSAAAADGYISVSDTTYNKKRMQ